MSPVRPASLRNSPRADCTWSCGGRYSELKNAVRVRAALQTVEEAEAFGKVFNFKVSWQAGQAAERLLTPKL